MAQAITKELLLKEISVKDGDCTRQFEVHLSEFVAAQEDDSELRKWLENGKDIQTKYIGFYGLFVYYRRVLEYDRITELFEEYGAEFEQKYMSVKHLRSINYIDSDDKYEPEEIMAHLENGYQVARSYKKLADANKRDSQVPGINVAGASHAFADLVATYCERYESMSKEIIAKWYDKAMDAVEEAKRLSPKYAKYNCTEGRLRAQKDEYENAIACIRKAIRLESPSGNKENYSLRILQYQSYIVQIQARQQMYKLNCHQERINDDIDSLKGSLVSNIEILGFFAGVISFVIGSLTLADGQATKDAAALVLVLMGALLVVMDCFSLLLHIERKHLWMKLLVLVVGVLIVLGGLYIVW